MNRMQWINALSACFLVACTGCERFLGSMVVGSGVPASRAYAPDQPYEVLDIRGAMHVQAAVGDSATLTVTADDNILPLFGVEVREGRWVIKLDGRVKPVTPVRVDMTTAPIVGVVCAGAVTARLEEITGDRLDATVAGASDLALAGSVAELSLDSAGASHVDASGLAAQRLTVTLTAAGSVKTHADEHLNATITGVGEVTYTGNPQVEKSIIGMGAVK